MKHTRTARFSYAALIISGIIGAAVFRAPTAPTFAAERTAGDAAKPTIVLVHGAFANGTGWQHVIPILERDGYSVRTVEVISSHVPSIAQPLDVARLIERAASGAHQSQQ